MFADPYAANHDVSGAGGTKACSIVSVNGTGTVRVFTTPTTNYPEVMRISHTTVGKGQALRNRHLIRLEKFQEDGAVKLSTSGALYMVADFPVFGFTATMQEKMLRQLVGIVRGGSGDAFNELVPATFLDRWAAGES